MQKTSIAPSKQTALKTIYTALTILRENGYEMNRTELINKLKETVSFTDSELEIMESNGNPRWLTVFLFYTVDCQKAGYITKQKGTWYLTKEGEAALKKGDTYLLDSATKAYRKWSVENKSKKIKLIDIVKNQDEITENKDQTQIIIIEDLEEKARKGIIDFIKIKNPYDFQELVAALLRAMGYYTPFIAPKGRDGGVDIIAFHDPLGVTTPRLKVQIKHYPSTPIAVDDVRSLKGIVNANAEIGLFVTSGTFSKEANRFARENGTVHIRLIDGAELVELWKTYYFKLNDEEKNMLPLHPVYFLGSNE